MKDLGSFLKRTRIGNGVSLEEAADDMELSTTQLENIEIGNAKAFKDIYELREYVKNYAKYLGLDVNVVNDTFNDFLFEKTSKISLEDIKEAEKIAKSKSSKTGTKKKVKSPYTIVRRRKINLWPVLIWLGIVFLVVAISLIIVKNIDREPTRSSELQGIMEDYYEFTY